MIKLVAIDLDGTIVNDQLEISKPVLNLLNHLITQTPVKVVIATGRMHPSAISFAKKIGVKEPLISYQGAMINTVCKDETLLHHAPIPQPLAKEILDFLTPQNYAINLYINNVLYINHCHDHATYYSRLAGIQPNYLENLQEGLTGAPSKIMIIDDYRVDEILEALKSRFSNQINFCRSRSNFCEIIDQKASKWQALEHLLPTLDIAPSEVLAIGDQENDLSMITGAGTGVAMGNAPDFVKAQADFITSSIKEDGFVKAIQTFLPEIGAA